MTAFVSLYCYLFIIWMISQNIKDIKERRTFQSVASALGLLFLLGFHSPALGCDVAGSYIPAFERMGTQFVTSIDDSIYGFELGYMNYMALIHHFTDDAQVFLFITALIILIPIIVLIYKYSKNVMLSILIYTSWYLYYFSFSGLRQAMAIGICAIATNFLFKRKLLPFVAIVYLASLFHTSALLFLLVYPMYVYRYKISNKKLFILGILAICILVFFQGSMRFVAMILFGSESRYVESLENSEFGGVTIALIYLAFALFQMFVDKKNSNPYLPILFFLAAIQMTGMYSQTIPRLTYYFIPIFSLSFPQALNAINKNMRFMYQSALLILFVSFFIMQASSHYLDVTPFKFFWE